MTRNGPKVLRATNADEVDELTNFDRTWDQRLYMMKRQGRIEGDCVVLYCTVDEIQTAQLPVPNEVIAEVNETYKQFVIRQAALDKQSAEQQAAANELKNRRSAAFASSDAKSPLQGAEKSYVAAARTWNLQSPGRHSEMLGKKRF